MTSRRARRRAEAQEILRKTREAESVREGRAVCSYEFEPLWRPAPYLPWRAAESHLDRANRTEAAKRTAFACLGAQLGLRDLPPSFDAIDDLATLRAAFKLIWCASIADVRRWADKVEEEAQAA